MTEETKLREEMCLLAKSLFDRGLTGGSTGNISARTPDGGLLVSPTGTSFGRLDPARLSRFGHDLLLVRDPKEMPARIVYGLHEIFSVPQVAVRLWDVAPDFADLPACAPVGEDTRRMTAALKTPYCGLKGDIAQASWLADDGTTAPMSITTGASLAGSPNTTEAFTLGPVSVGGSALGDGVDNAEGLKEGTDDVDDQQKERGRGDQRQHDAEKAAPEMRAINGCGLDHRPWHRLQRGKEKQEVIADPPPCRGDDDKAHCLASVQDVVPVIAQISQIPRHNAHASVEHEQPQHTRNSRGHGVGPD